MKIPLFLIVISLVPALKAEVLPIDMFTRHGDYLNMRISPDGEHIVARARSKSSVILLFIRRNDMKVFRYVDPGKGNSVHSVTWVNNERVVYELAEKGLSYDRPRATGELYGVSIDGSRHTILYGVRAGDGYTGSRIGTRQSDNASQEVLSLLEDDDKHILIVEYPERNTIKEKLTHSVISKLNVYTGKKKKIEILPHHHADALAYKDGRVSFISWEGKDNSLRVAYRKTPKDDWQELTSAFDVKEYSKLRPVKINSTSSKAYLTGLVGNKKIKTMLELDLTSGKLTELFGGLKADLTGWVTDADNQPVVGTSFPDVKHYHYLNNTDPTVRAHKLLVKAFKGQNISITSKTKNEKLLLVKVRSDINPGEYYLFDKDSREAKFLWANRSWIDPRQMQPMRPIEVAARDGLALHGYLTMPKRSAEKVQRQKPPMVLMVHGGPHSRDYWGFNSIVQLLANRGYAVLQINYRGSTGYGRTFRRSGYRQWGGKMIDDIVDATKWAVDQGSIDSKRMCIYGASFGGYAALMTVARKPDLFQCAIGYVGVYDLSIMYEKGDIYKSWGGKAYMKKTIGTDKKQLAEFSPVNYADKIKAEIMLIHGEQDKRAPIIHSRKMRSALKKAGKKVAWLNYQDSGHGVWDPEARKELYTKLVGFLDRHIGSGRVTGVIAEHK